MQRLPPFSGHPGPRARACLPEGTTPNHHCLRLGSSATATARASTNGTARPARLNHRRCVPLSRALGRSSEPGDDRLRQFRRTPIPRIRCWDDASSSCRLSTPCIEPRRSAAALQPSGRHHDRAYVPPRHWRRFRPPHVVETPTSLQSFPLPLPAPLADSVGPTASHRPFRRCHCSLDLTQCMTRNDNAGPQASLAAIILSTGRLGYAEDDLEIENSCIIFINCKVLYFL
ncbi:formin-like protein 3 isoform X1 [Iris pallida]|uniref:Formin-like protein 3 isoform X1 n=1 Tax=Iris pallida TaxID=29817 RepID=A0AAX6IIA7_IRIPA|nr:formin-like protein 3 isoform X1 [Iris pallida]